MSLEERTGLNQAISVYENDLDRLENDILGAVNDYAAIMNGMNQRFLNIFPGFTKRMINMILFRQENSIVTQLYIIKMGWLLLNSRERSVMISKYMLEVEDYSAIGQCV